jgi:X-X-X-Leu-X-X-Gly heptad repeat protein
MFSSLRLNTKLIGSVVAVALVTAVLAFVSFRGMDTAVQQLNLLFAQSRKQKAAADVNAEFQLAISKAKNYAILKDGKNKDKTADHLKNAMDDAALLQTLAASDDEKRIFGDIANAVASVQPKVNALLATAVPKDKAEALYHAYLENITEPFDQAISSYVVALDERTATELEQKIRATKALLMLGVMLVIVGLALNLSVALGVSKSLGELIGALNDGVEQVATGSNQVAGSSQQLAEGASESASSLEETSSSMEEMASMTRQNSENATRANRLMEEARAAVDKGSLSVESTLKSMLEMNESAEKVSRIIKTIEEIAFQTNLLALNAAVEAARAGDHGRGFAVVAEEVRNLASRSASAARDTALLIEENARRAGLGMQVSSEAGKSLAEIVQSSTKVAALIGEIAAASQEQSRGIGEINSAVGQMDKVTQRVTANAEELSSASEEMSSQAMLLRDMVRRLVRIVEGGREAEAAVSSKSGDFRPGAPLEPLALRVPFNGHRPAGHNGNGHVAPQKARELVLAGVDVIPMSKDDLRAF